MYINFTFMSSSLFIVIIVGILLIFLIVVRCCERKLMKLRRKIFILKELAQIRGMFVNITSHELRNPMTTIYSSIDLLENYSGRLDESEKLRIFDNIRKSIRRMTKMMDDVVLIGQLQHRKIIFDPQNIDVLQASSFIIDGLQRESNEKRIRILLDSNVNPIACLDQALLDHILANLLSNALKYSKGDVILQIKTRGPWIIFDVIDRGIGIPKDEIYKLSQLFRRCSNIGSRRGIGIGMYLVTNCVALHKGKIKVSSQEGKGTHFRVMLPKDND